MYIKLRIMLNPPPVQTDVQQRLKPAANSEKRPQALELSR